MHAGGPLSGRAAKVKAARRLHRRASRAEARRFLAEGPQAVREAVAAGGVAELFCTAGAAERHPELVADAGSGGADVYEVTDDALAAVAGTVHPQGLVAVCPYVDVDLAAALRGSPRLVAVLVHVRDPGNAGTVLRTADAAGADAVVLTDASVDVYNGKCVRSAAGSLFHLPVVTGVPLDDLVAAAREHGLRLLAADAGGARSVDGLADDGTLVRPTCWLFGNEAWGLPAEAVEAADASIRVPIHGRAESLNLSVSAALCMYASARAQRAADHLVRQDESSREGHGA